MKILLMEDDAVLSDIILDYLQEFFEVDYAYDGDEVYDALKQNKYDLFIFDINVPGKNGLALLQELRSFSNATPTIFITAYRDTDYLKKAFDVGAHDYIKKPFELDELKARILNTKRLFNIDFTNLIQISQDISFSQSTKELIKKDKKLSLGNKDVMILSYFLQHPKRVISSEELTQNVWDFDTIPSDATLRSHIRTLRELIGKERINTVRGEGYMYE